MADDSREPDNGKHQPTIVGAATSDATKLPKGIMLGKDGKPCRTCSTIQDWATQSKTLMKGKAAAAIPARPPSDCPADVETLGRGTWTLLHTIAATYPERPTPSEQTDLVGFMGLFSKLYPCWVCADDFRDYMRRDPIRARTRDEFGTWLCNAHNDVNKKLGKPVFDCNLWQERWRTGWKDGRCG